MKFKKISRQDLIDKATRIINKPPASVNDFSYESREWWKIKNNYIEENPLCELCLNEGNENKSEDVHHITPLSHGGEPFLEDNLIALCQPCHGSIHGSAGIAIEISDSFSGLDGLNNFSTQLKKINENLISQYRMGEALNLIRERKPYDNSYVGVANKSGEHLGDINPSDVGNYYLAFDIDHGVEVSAQIKQIFTKRGKLECIIEISKGDVDWEEDAKLWVKDGEASEIIFQAKTLEKTNIEEAIFLYRKAIEIIKEIDITYGNFARYHVRFPINRLSLVLERQKKYKECLEEIEAYEKLTDKLGLYAGDKERLEKRKEKIIKIIKRCQQGAASDS